MKYEYSVEECLSITPSQALKKFKLEEGSKKLDVWLSGVKFQTIELEQLPITYGQMWYFNCGCGYRALKLYMTPDSDGYGCRTCKGLKYRISSINSSSVAGRAIHRLQKIEKVSMMRSNIGRVFYRGQYTEKYMRFLDQCARLGLKDAVRDAEKLKYIVESQDISTNSGLFEEVLKYQ